MLHLGKIWGKLKLNIDYGGRIWKTLIQVLPCIEVWDQCSFSKNRECQAVRNFSGDTRSIAVLHQICASTHTWNYLSAIFVKPQQWPTPSESIAILLRKETSFVYYTSSVLRKSPYLRYGLWQTMWPPETKATPNAMSNFVSQKCRMAVAIWVRWTVL